MKPLPAVEAALPHASPMLLLAEIEAHEPTRTVCRIADPGRSVFADSSGNTPAWVALEYMAQCCAVHGSLSAGDAPPGVGFLIGSRCLELDCGEFTAGQELGVSVQPVFVQRHLAAFDCEVVDKITGQRCASAQLKLYLQPAAIGDPSE